MRKKHSFIALLALFLLLSGIYSCQKNRDRISLSRWHPAAAAPFIQTELNLGDIIPWDSNLNTAPDSSLFYAYHQDSLFVITADSLFQLSENGLDSTYTVTLGSISIDTFSLMYSFSMNDALPYLDPAVRDTLLAHNHQTAIFPPFTFDDSFTIEGAPIEVYDYLTFLKGYFTINITNRLPVTLTDVYITVTEQSYGVTLKNIHISQLDSAQVYTDTLVLHNKTIGNRISFVVNGFSSDGSYPDSVYIDLDQGLEFTAAANEMKVIAGKAKIPQQIIFSDSKMIDFAADEGVKLYQILFSRGTLDFHVNSMLPMRIYIELKLPTGIANGVIPHADLVLPAMGTTDGSVSFENMELDLTSDSLKPYNRFPVYTGIVIMPTNELVEFDSSDAVITRFYSSEIKPAYAKGYFGKRTVTLTEGTASFDLGALSGIQGAIYFDNPTLTIKYRNSVGLPIKLKPNILSRNNTTGQQVDLALDSLILTYPDADTEFVTGEINVDKTNSEIVDFLSIKPETILYSGGSLINWNEDTLNFIYDTSSFVADIDLHLPMIFQADHLMLSDTLPITPPENPLPLQESMLKVQIENGFPFDMVLTMQLSDSTTGNLLTTLELGQIKAAPVNANGRVIHPVHDSLNIRLDNTFFQMLQQANRGIFKAKIATFSHGNVPVGLYTDYKTKIAIGIVAVINP